MEKLRIIDYVIEQSERNDINNISYEKDIINRIANKYVKMHNSIMNHIGVYGVISSQLRVEVLLQHIGKDMESFINGMWNELERSIFDYTSASYKQVDDLIQVGLDAEDRLLSIKEIKKNKIYGDDTISFLKKHAYEQVTNMSAEFKSKARQALGQLYLENKYDRKSVADSIEAIMKVPRQRALTIAQQELSMAYNIGTLMRLDEFNQHSDRQVMKYWHGFKYSDVTCTDCRPKIGTYYALDDNTYSLPLHVKCRCVWLPFMDGWDKPISSVFTRNANMVNRAFTPQEVYDRINLRLGIDYGRYIDVDRAEAYIRGDRSPAVYDAIANGRNAYISDVVKSFDLVAIDMKQRMANEYRIQMGFWKNYVASAIADKDREVLKKSYDAIKGIMILPWSADQLIQFNNLLDAIGKHI